MRYPCFASLLALAAAQSLCPEIDLPWGRYVGTLNTNEHICVYSNIRFASPPLGELRFKAPKYPPNSKLPLPDAFPSCIQAEQDKCLSTNAFDEAPKCFPKYYGHQSEDCLFLDVYVPKQAFVTAKPLPVVVWFYGGAYLYGSKTYYDPNVLPFYDGEPLVDRASKLNKPENSVIFVRGNYRLGAFGWLAGSYMEKYGQPNAGLLDQRAILQFVQEHISKMKGNPDAVSVWGESAGASSIMHHLVMPQNGPKPLFQKAILQSPAYQWLWDRKGDLNDTYTDFARNASCPSGDIECLQKTDTNVLRKANQRVFQRQACEGIMPLGPSVDGKLVPDLAPIRFMKNQFFALDTIVVSHTHNEVPYPKTDKADSFIPLPIREDKKNETTFDNFLEEVFTGRTYGGVRDKIRERYPKKKYKDQMERAANVITDSSFTCNTRFVIDGYLSAGTKVYAMDYSILSIVDAATHASDILPLFSNPKVKYDDFLGCVGKLYDIFKWAPARLIQGWTAPRFQRLFLDHAIWGNPNQNLGNSYEWLPAYRKECAARAQDTCVWNVMKPSGGVTAERVFEDRKGADIQTSSGTCDFWSEIAQDISKLSRQDLNDELEDTSEQVPITPELK